MVDIFHAPIKPLIIPSEVPAEDNHKTSYVVESQPLDGFVAVDIGALSLHADEPVSNRNLARTMSRKGSQKTPDGDTNCTGGTGAGDKLETYAHVAGANGETLNGHTGMATANPGGKCRRLNSRRSLQWINPRRVLFTFATVNFWTASEQALRLFIPRIKVQYGYFDSALLHTVYGKNDNGEYQHAVTQIQFNEEKFFLFVHPRYSKYPNPIQ